MERSDNVPLNYCIVVRERTRTTDDLLKLLFWEKYCWKSIKLLSSRGPRFGDLHLESTDMSRLQKLSICFDEDTEIERDIDLLNSSQLRSLDLSGARSDLWRVIMGTVQTQQLTELELGLTYNGFEVEDPYLITSLGMFINLKHLKIEFHSSSYFPFHAWYNPFILLPNLCTLFLHDSCEKLIECLTTPSIITIDIIGPTHGEYNIYKFLKRSSPPLENRLADIRLIKTDDLVHIFLGLPMLKTLRLVPEGSGDLKLLLNIRIILYIKDLLVDWLLPNLTRLEYCDEFYLNRDMIEKVAILSHALLSRRRYYGNFRFQIEGDLKFPEDFPYNLKNLLCTEIDVPDYTD